MTDTEDATPIPTGIAGLDHILEGGYARNRSHLVEGRPGSGKTTLALQFLRDGVRAGERCLYITLTESRRELASVAARHGWSLDGLDIFELIPPELSLDPAQQQSLLHASDLELGETVQITLAEVERRRPQRLVFDSISEIRLLSQGSLRYRRQVLALRNFFLLQNITVLFLDDIAAEQDDFNLHSLSHGVVRLEQLAPLYGGERRRLRVIKMRGTHFKGGYNDFVIRRGGLVVFPRLVAAEHLGEESSGAIASGLTALDALLGGGLERGTSTMLLGPSGVGKSSLSLVYARASLEHGERVLALSFDETISVTLRRARSLGLPIDDHVADGRLRIEQIDPAEVSPGELSALVREAVERDGVGMIVIDSLTGYHNALPEEQHLHLQMHELLTYLSQKGVATILVLAQHGLVGPMRASTDLTYLSDTVVLFRFFEAGGRLHRAISVVKRRTGPHEDTIRELRLDAQGLRVGKPLTDFHGVLSGVPMYQGANAALLRDRDDDGGDEPTRTDRGADGP